MIELILKLLYPQFIKFSASVSIIAEATPSKFPHLFTNLMKKREESKVKGFSITIDVLKPLVQNYYSVMLLIIIGVDHLLCASDTMMSGIRGSH